MNWLPTASIAALLGIWCLGCQAEIYVYEGPGGDRVVTDQPMPGYKLVSRRDTVRDAGHALAGRPVARQRPGRLEDYAGYIASASERHDLDPALLKAVIQVESHFDPNAVSRAGAAGLMQLMESTAEQHKVKDRFDPGANIDAGAKHLKYLMQRFDGELRLVLAAYNAGATNVDKYRDIPPFPETEQFVAKVLGLHLQYRQGR